MGESVDLPCFSSGEDMEDDLDHYLECDTFWTLLVTSAGLNKDPWVLLPFASSLPKAWYSPPYHSGLQASGWCLPGLPCSEA